MLRKEFVLLDDPKDSSAASLLLTRGYSVAVKTWQSITPTGQEGETCVFVRILTWDTPAKVFLNQNFCGSVPVKLPDYLWH